MISHFYYFFQMNFSCYHVELSSINIWLSAFSNNFFNLISLVLENKTKDMTSEK